MVDESGSGTHPTRRRALRILALGGVAGVVAWRLGRGAWGLPVAVTRSAVLMGTEVMLSVIGDDREAAQEAIDAALGRMAELEALLSRHRPDSEVSRLNRDGNLPVPSPTLLEVLALSGRVSDLGAGAFDISVHPLVDLYRERSRADSLPTPAEIEAALERVDRRAIRIEDQAVRFDRPGMAITLDGVAKGYIVDQGVAVLDSRGFHNVLVEAGGDLVVEGAKGPEVPWRIGVRNPRPGLALLARFDARDVAIATSGDYMQPFTPDLAQHHIMDPRTGASPPELASSTVLAPSGAWADALATLTLVLGSRRAVELIENLDGCEGYFVGKDLAITKTSGFVVA